MNITLRRTDFRSDGIFGEVLDATGTHIYYSLEHAYLQNDGSYAPKLPQGVYKCVRGTHQLEHGGPFETFEVSNVAGHQGILWHRGNYNADSNGCILIANNLVKNSDWMIGSSAPAFNQFMSLQTGVDEFTLTVENT